MLPDKQWIDFVLHFWKLPVIIGIEDEQANTDDQKQRELNEDDHPTGEQCGSALAFGRRGEKALDHQLFGAVTGGGEKASADDACPKAVGAGEKNDRRGETE